MVPSGQFSFSPGLLISRSVFPNEMFLPKFSPGQPSIQHGSIVPKAGLSPWIVWASLLFNNLACFSLFLYSSLFQGGEIYAQVLMSLDFQSVPVSLHLHILVSPYPCKLLCPPQVFRACVLVSNRPVASPHLFPGLSSCAQNCSLAFGATPERLVAFFRFFCVSQLATAGSQSQHCCGEGH